MNKKELKIELKEVRKELKDIRVKKHELRKQGRLWKLREYEIKDLLKR